jgi:hypothetical protein
VITFDLHKRASRLSLLALLCRSSGTHLSLGAFHKLIAVSPFIPSGSTKGQPKYDFCRIQTAPLMVYLEHRTCGGLTKDYRAARTRNFKTRNYR